MYNINLNDLKFKSYHGLFEEEKILGNNFIVNLSIDTNISTKPKSIEDCIDYSSVFEFVKNKMDTPTELLENLCFDIANEILIQFIHAQKVFISITKKNPAIKNFVGDVTVSYSCQK